MGTGPIGAGVQHLEQEGRSTGRVHAWRNGGDMVEDIRHQLASDFARRLVACAALTYPELPVLEATQLKAHDLQEAGLLTEPQHHDLFMVTAWESLEEPGRTITQEEITRRLAADLVSRLGLFPPAELQRLSRVALDLP
jgi:hypothetical protein